MRLSHTSVVIPDTSKMLLIVYVFLCGRSAKQEPASCFPKIYDICGSENLALKMRILHFSTSLLLAV